MLQRDYHDTLVVASSGPPIGLWSYACLSKAVSSSTLRLLPATVRGVGVRRSLRIGDDMLGIAGNGNPRAEAEFEPSVRVSSFQQGRWVSLTVLVC